MNLTAHFDCYTLTLVQKYIEALTKGRSRDGDGDGVIYDIDDIRNGLFVNVLAHRHLGRNVAILKVRARRFRYLITH